MRPIRRQAARLLFCCLICTLAACGNAPKEESPVDPRLFQDTCPAVTPDADTHVTFSVTDPADAYEMYAPREGRSGYRYGPSILYYPDGSMDAWFATPGTGSEWDWFTYRHSPDGGVTWTDEKLVLRPTADSMDHYSVCDPGVIYLNGWFYIGYTSTIVNTGGGINNNGYVARSREPDGPYEKWNGSGWGGDPAPIVYFNETSTAWGAGEFSFAAVGGTLYCYYTWTCPEGSETRVATADADSALWPATLTDRGVAYTRGPGQDSCDVVYIEDLGKFAAFSTYERFSINSGISVMESDDGLRFSLSTVVRTDIAQYCHNMGIAKRPDGHVRLGDPQLVVGYAYAEGEGDYWGKWGTRFQPIRLETYTGALHGDRGGGIGTQYTPAYRAAGEEAKRIGVGFGTVNFREILLTEDGDNTITIPFYWYDTDLQMHRLRITEGFTVSGYDPALVEIDGFRITAKAPGVTTFTLSFEGFTAECKLRIRPIGYAASARRNVVSAAPVQPQVFVALAPDGAPQHKPQLRAFVRFDDDSWGEAYNDSIFDVNYKTLVERQKFPVEYTVADPGCLTVDEHGIVTPLRPGTTEVQMTVGGISCTVSVTVTGG